MKYLIRFTNVYLIICRNLDDQFIVEWRHVLLQDSASKAPFTFQTTLYKNGTIVFAYKSIPIRVKDINDTNHPVKIGLSDAYIRDRNVFGKLRKYNFTTICFLYVTSWICINMWD